MKPCDPINLLVGEIRLCVLQFEFRERATIDVTFVSLKDSNVVIAFDRVVGVFSCGSDRFLREPHHPDEVAKVDDSINARRKVVKNHVECRGIRVEISQHSRLHSAGSSLVILVYFD